VPGSNVRVQVVGPLASAHLLWRQRGQLHLTIIAKSAFAFAPGGVMTALPPEPIVAADVHHHDDVTLSIRVASDLVPFLRRADVLFSGFAHATQGPTSAMDVRLALRDSRTRADDPHAKLLLEKVLHVVGDATGPEERKPFEVMALTYERAFGGIGSEENPLGTGNGPSKRPPNVTSAVDPGKTAGFAPISSAFPARAVHLPPGLAPALIDPTASEILAIPDRFDWSYFQAAPPDQQIEYLRGDETLVLDGLHPTLAHLETRLPGIAILGRIAGAQADDGTFHPLVLRADTLCIDGANQRVTVTWRAVVPLQSEAAAKDVRVQLLSSRAAESAWWPDWDEDETSTFAGAFAGTATRHLTPAPHVERKTPGAGDTLVLDGETDREKRQLSLASTMLIIDEETTLDAKSEAVPVSIEPSTVPRAKSTVAPRTERVTLDKARAVPFVVSGPIGTATLAWRWEGRPGAFRTVVVKLLADLVHGGDALIRDEAPTVRPADVTSGEGDEMIVRLPSDLAPVKPKADICLVGSARVAEGATVTGRGEVRFAFGKTIIPSSRSSPRIPAVSSTTGEGPAFFDRKIRVFGDRVWRDVAGELLPGQPSAYESMPISWDRAYGGPGFEANPAGIGYVPNKKETPKSLPHLEWAERPIMGPRDKVKPASFAPIPPWWQARVALRGKQDEAYQHAPIEQRLHVVEGDEAYIMEGFHATMRRIDGNLPGERVRGFMLRGQKLEEIALRLDAVTFDADELTVELTWRGICEVEDADATDVETFFARTEALGDTPATLDDCAAELAKKRDQAMTIS
jgi:hypothetical protein